LLLQALFAADRPWLAAVLLLLLAGAFAGLMHYAGQLTGGTAPHSYRSIPLNYLTRFVLVGSLLLVAIGGLFLPDMLVQLLNDATLIALGGTTYAKP
jgi:hydrogenase-4 component F